MTAKGAAFPMIFRRHFTWRDLFYAWGAATVLSGIPSTIYAVVSGADPLEATIAAGAMLLPGEASVAKRIAAAALVHPMVSAFWAAAVAYLVPPRHVLSWAVIASIAIALLDLRIIAPVFFPDVAALDFWPQLADHVMWGACFGGTLALRNARSDRNIQTTL